MRKKIPSSKKAAQDDGGQEDGRKGKKNAAKGYNRKKGSG